jgi:hypothetical protein
MPQFKNFLRWKRAAADAIGDDPEIVQQIVNNNTFITEVTSNETFVTELTENNTFVTNVTQTITNVINGKKGVANELATLDADGKITAAQLQPGVINFVIDGGGSAITTGFKGVAMVPFDCTIDRVDVLGNASGSIVVDIWRDTYANHPPVDADSITASAPATLSSAVKSRDSTLTGWTKQLNEDDILAFNVDSAATVTSVTVSLKISHR